MTYFEEKAREYVVKTVGVRPITILDMSDFGRLCAVEGAKAYQKAIGHVICATDDDDPCLYLVVGPSAVVAEMEKEANPSSKSKEVPGE